MDLYSMLVAHITDIFTARLATLERQRDDIRRIEDVTERLNAAGFRSHARPTQQGSIYIYADGDIKAIAKHVDSWGYIFTAWDTAHRRALILPPATHRQLLPIAIVINDHDSNTVSTP